MGYNSSLSVQFKGMFPVYKAPLYSHVVFAPSAKDSYTGTAFSGLTDLLTDMKTHPDDDALWRAFDEHLAAVTHLVSTAGKGLTLDLW